MNNANFSFSINAYHKNNIAEKRIGERQRDREKKLWFKDSKKRTQLTKFRWLKE